MTDRSTHQHVLAWIRDEITRSEYSLDDVCYYSGRARDGDTWTRSIPCVVDDVVKRDGTWRTEMEVSILRNMFPGNHRDYIDGRGNDDLDEYIIAVAREVISNG